MIGYRPFRNSDPPHLADIWRNSPPQRKLAQPLSPAMFDELVLAKSYFDPQGLIVAVDGPHRLGFVHAGFGPSDDGSRLSYERGAVCMLLVHSHDDEQAIADELLARAERYLRDRGATELYAGGIGSLSPFYLGLYGGSELPGILDSDAQNREFFVNHGYRDVDRVLVFHRELAGFRPAVDRTQMQVRRGTTVRLTADPPARNWWEACTMGCFEQTLAELISRDGASTVASARFWNMGPLSATRGVHAAGLTAIDVTPPRRRQGLATYLLGEAMRQLHTEGITLIEAHAEKDNTAAAAILRKLGFNQTDAGTVLRKE